MRRCIFFIVLFVGSTQCHGQLTRTHIDGNKYSFVAPIVQKAIEVGETPGAVVVVASSKAILYADAFGDRQVEPERERMTLNTVFDLASISKPIATATSIMVLVDQGKIDVSAKACDYVPEFAEHGKDAITLHQLLLHTSGLTPDNALGDYKDGPEIAWKRICSLKLRSEPGTKFSYSDVGYIVLGKIVQQVSGQPLDQFAKQYVFAPLKMNATQYNPTDSQRQRAAATEKRNGDFIKGTVHDPRAHLMNGVAGHAGVFSTAGDLVRYGQAMLHQGQLDGHRVLSEQTFALMAKPRDILRGTRTYGWDHQSPYSRNRGKSFSRSAFGHGGFTGTVLWIDPVRDRVFIFLSTRLHPDGMGSINAIAGEIATQLPTD